MRATLHTIETAVPELSNARGAITARTSVVLALEHGAHVGLGEAAPLAGFSVESSRDVREALASVRWPARLRIEDIAAAIEPIAPPSARFAAECALLDLAARHEGVPLWRLLVPTEPAPLANAAVLWSHDRASLAEAARQAARASVAAVKIKSVDPDALACVREILPDAALRIDANRTVPQSSLTATLARLRTYSPEFVEEPSDLESTLALRESPVPIALDESIASSAERAFGSPVVRTFVLKPTLLGGLIRTRSLAERASASGRSFVISHLLEGEIARAACAHLALALGGLAAGLGDHPALARLSGGRHAAWIGPAWIEPPRAAGLGLTHD